MGGKVSLPVAVEIGFGAGPLDASVTWTDVSTRVQRSKTISCNRQVDPDTLTPGDGRGQIRFSNDTGDLTPGRTGVFGLVRNRLPIRVRQGSTVVWTGLIEKWSAGVDGIRPVVDATLVDRWPRMRQRVLTGDRIEQVCLSLAAQNLWPLTDPPGSTRAASLTSQWSLLPIGDGAVGWGLATNPHSPASGQLPAVQFPAPPLAGLAPAWDGPGAASVGVYAAGLTMSIWVRCPTTGASTTLDVDAPYGLDIRASQTDVTVLSTHLGSATVTLPASSAWRHVAVTAAVSGDDVTVTTYVDGAPADTRTVTAAGWSPARQHYITGGSTGQAAYCATWDRPLTAAEVHLIWAAGSSILGTTGQTADQRAALIAALWPPTAITTQGAFAATMSKQAVDGVSQADLLSACAVTEGGSLHISPDGWPVLSSRGYRSAAAPVAVIVDDYDDAVSYDMPVAFAGGTTGDTIPAAVIDPSAVWELDDTQIVNVVTVERMALNESASTVSRRTESSVALYGEVPKQVAGWWDTDVQAVERADTEAAMWADPAPRSKSFTVDLMTCGAAVGAATLLAVDIGSRIVISGLPAVVPTQTAAGWYVDAIADEITESSWKRTFTVSPAIDYLVIDDPTFGGLDEWPLG